VSGWRSRPADSMIFGTAARDRVDAQAAMTPRQGDVRMVAAESSMSYQDVITIEPGKRGGRPCVRGLRIAVSDVLGWLAAGMTYAEILSQYPELSEDDIRACLAYAADRERRVITAAK
jgi:uncharacterized protein (DUF433 family)